MNSKHYGGIVRKPAVFLASGQKTIPKPPKKPTGFSSSRASFQDYFCKLQSGRGLPLEITFPNSRGGLLFKMKAANTEIGHFNLTLSQTKQHKIVSYEIA